MVNSNRFTFIWNSEDNNMKNHFKESKRKKFEIRTKVCKRCGNTYETESKGSKICEKCDRRYK